MRENLYPVQCFVPCWLGGDGFLAGLPVFAVVLRERGSVPLRLHDVFDRVARDMPSGDAAPRAVAFVGDERFIDERLLMIFRIRLRAFCYAEYGGERPMEDRNGGFPRWDHAAIRLRHAKVPLSGGLLFNSVVVPAPAYPDELTRLGRMVDKTGAAVQKFASASGRSDSSDARVVREAASSGFRLTRPVSHEPLPVA